MVIRQILNNNVVVTLDEQGRECVVCGKGIAYKKHVGSFVPESAVNKVFVAENSSERQRLVTAHVRQGEHVQKGQKLISFDKAAIEREGYKTETVMVITNTDDYLDVVELTEGETSEDTDLLAVLA